MESNKGIIFNYAIGRYYWEHEGKNCLNFSLLGIDSQIIFWQELLTEISSLDQIFYRNTKNYNSYETDLHSNINSYKNQLKNKRYAFYTLEPQSKLLPTRFSLKEQAKVTMYKIFWKNCPINLNKILSERIFLEILLLSDIDSLKKSFFNKIKFSQNIQTFSSIKDSLSDELKEKLYQFIIYSKDSEEISIAASNAISLLNLAEFSFTNKNLENIKIPEADLSCGNWIYTNFKGSDLTNANFSYSNIYSSNFKNCKLNSNNFSEITINAHKNWVTSICYSPCGQYLASGSADTTIKLWCLKTLQEIKVFKGHQQTIKCVAYSPNGNILASAGMDRTVRLWDIETCNELLLLANRYLIPTTVAFSPCGGYLAYSHERRDIKILNINAKKTKSIKLENEDIINKLLFTNCGRYLIVGYESSWVSIWELEKLTKIKKFSSLYGVRSLSCVAHKKFMAACGNKGVKIWNLFKDSETVKFENYPNIVNAVVLSCENKMASCSLSGIYLYDLDLKRQTHLLLNHSEIVSTIAFSPCGKFLASGSWDKTIKIWKMQSLQQKEKEILGSINAVVWSSCGNFFITCDSSGAIFVWCAKTFKIIKKLKSHIHSVSSIAISPCNNYLVSGGVDSDVKLWDLKSGQLIRSHQERLGVIFVAFSPCGKHVISCLTRDWSFIYHKQFFSDSKIQHSENSTEAINSISISNTGKYLAIALAGDYIALWASKTLKRVKKLYTFQASILVTAFSPCDEFLASGGNEKTIEIYSLESGKAIKHFQGHGGNISALAFSPCGKCLASGSCDKSIIVWDIESRTILNQLLGHLDAVTSLCYSPCGRFILSGSRDKTIKIWNDESYNNKGEKSELKEEICERNKYRLLWSSWCGSTSIFNSKIEKNNESQDA